MLIVLEGPDRTGKTTLARALARRLAGPVADVDVDVLHRGPPTAHPIDEYEVPLWGYRPGTGRHVICDRWHVGEVVYPAVYGRATAQTPAVALHVELLLRSRGALLVHVTADVATLRDRLEVELRGSLAGRVDADAVVDRSVRTDVARARAAAELQLRTVDRVAAAFDVAVAASTLSAVRVCANDDVDRVAADIVAEARRREAAATPLNDAITYVGPPRPRVVLLGDTRGPRNGDATAPAFVPRSVTSGAYLLDALAVAARPWRPELLATVGVANACDVDHVTSLLDALDRPVVVTLGRNAALELDALHVPHVELPHPQWVRRFWHRERARYGRQVLGIDAPEPLDAWTARPWQRYPNGARTT